MKDFCLNPLSPKGDQRQFSPNHIHTLLSKRDVRINIMISKGEILWSIMEFFWLTIKGNVWRSVCRTCTWIFGAERVKQGQGLKALGGAHPYPNVPWMTSPSLLPPPPNDGVGYPSCFLGVVVKVIGFTFPFPGANMIKIINKPTTSEPYWDQFDIKCICKVISVAPSPPPTLTYHKICIKCSTKKGIPQLFGLWKNMKWIS